jgi:formiminoglutamase
VSEFVEEFLALIDVLHLSIDLDVLPAAVAPGVSAPAGFGVPLDVMHAVCQQVAGSGKLALMDVPYGGSTDHHRRPHRSKTSGMM